MRTFAFLFTVVAVHALSASNDICNCPSGVNNCTLNCPSPQLCCGYGHPDPQCYDPSRGQKCCPWNGNGAACNSSQTCCGGPLPFCCDAAATCCVSSGNGGSVCCPRGTECCPLASGSTCCSVESEFCSVDGCQRRGPPAAGHVMWSIMLGLPSNFNNIVAPLPYNSTHIIAASDALYFVQRADGVATVIDGGYAGRRTYTPPVMVASEVVVVCVNGLRFLNLSTMHVTTANISCELQPLLVAADGVVISKGAATAYDYITAVSVASAKVLWQMPITLALGDVVLATETMLLVSTAANFFAVDTATGGVVWMSMEASCNLPTIPAPLVVGNVTVACNQFGVGVATGAMLWKHVSVDYMTTLVADPSSRYLVSLNRSAVAAFSPSNGQIVWLRSDLGGASAVLTPLPELSIIAVSNGFNYFTAIASETGKTVWENNEGRVSPAFGGYSNGVWYALASSSLFTSGLAAIDTDSGKVLGEWGTFSPVSGGPVISGGAAYFGTGDAFLYALKLAK